MVNNTLPNNRIDKKVTLKKLMVKYASVYNMFARWWVLNVRPSSAPLMHPLLQQRMEPIPILGNI